MKKMLLLAIIIFIAIIFQLVYFSNESIADRAFKDKDYNKSIEYYEVSCKNKSHQSCKKLANIYFEGYANKDISKAILYQFQSCLYGCSDSCIFLYYRDDFDEVKDWSKIKKQVYQKNKKLQKERKNKEYATNKIIEELKKQVSEKLIEEGVMILKKNGMLRFPTAFELELDRIQNPTTIDYLKKAIKSP